MRRGIRALSLFAFSSENWARSPEEVGVLLGLLDSAIRDETPELREQGVQIRLLGRLDELPADTRASITEALAATADGDRLMLNVAFNYSGRHEIVDAARRCLDGRSDAPTRSTRTPSTRGSTPSACRRSTCSSARAASTASATS